MRTCQNCKHLIYPTMVGYACKKRGLWGTDIPLFFDGFECKKWKEIEETAELYVPMLKAAAMKDLPRWKTCFFPMGTENPFPRYLVRTGGALYSLTNTILKCDEYIPLSELEKLPRED